MTETESLIKAALETKFSEGAAENLEELIRMDERKRIAAEIQAMHAPSDVAAGFSSLYGWTLAMEHAARMVRGVGGVA